MQAKNTSRIFCRIGIHKWLNLGIENPQATPDIIARYSIRECKYCKKKQKEIIGLY